MLTTRWARDTNRWVFRGRTSAPESSRGAGFAPFASPQSSPVPWLAGDGRDGLPRQRHPHLERSRRAPVMRRRCPCQGYPSWGPLEGGMEGASRGARVTPKRRMCGSGFSTGGEREAAFSYGNPTYRKREGCEFQCQLEKERFRGGVPCLERMRPGRTRRCCPLPQREPERRGQRPACSPSAPLLLTSCLLPTSRFGCCPVPGLCPTGRSGDSTGSSSVAVLTAQCGRCAMWDSHSASLGLHHHRGRTAGNWGGTETKRDGTAGWQDTDSEWPGGRDWDLGPPSPLPLGSPAPA